MEMLGLLNLPRRDADREWSQPTGDKCVAGSRVGRVEPSKPFDIRHKAVGSGVLSDGVFPVFGPVCSHYVAIPSYLEW